MLYCASLQQNHRSRILTGGSDLHSCAPQHFSRGSSRSTPRNVVGSLIPPFHVTSGLRFFTFFILRSVHLLFFFLIHSSPSISLSYLIVCLVHSCSCNLASSVSSHWGTVFLGRCVAPPRCKALVSLYFGIGLLLLDSFWVIFITTFAMPQRFLFI